MDWAEFIAGDADHKYERAALVLRTLGWLGIAWAGLISVWIWMGARAGTYLWLWLAFAGSFGGLILIGFAAKFQIRAAETIDVPPETH